MQANKRTFKIEKEYNMYNIEDLMSEVQEVQSQNREMEQRLMFLTELVEKLLITRSSYEMRNPKVEEGPADKEEFCTNT